MKNSELQDYYDKGFLRVHVMFEVVGNPIDYVTKALDTVITSLEKTDGIVFLSKETEPAEDVGEGLFGTFCEAEILVKNLTKLSWLVYNYTPATVEILHPEKMTLTDKNLTDLFADLLAGLHEFNSIKVEINSKNMQTQRNMGLVIRNFVISQLKDTAKPADELAKPMGLKTEDLVKILEHMITEGTLAKENHLYRKV